MYSKKVRISTLAYAEIAEVKTIFSRPSLSIRYFHAKKCQNPFSKIIREIRLMRFTNDAPTRRLYSILYAVLNEVIH